MINHWVKEIFIFYFSAFFHDGHFDIGYLDHVTCDLLLATCFIWKSMKKSIGNIDLILENSVEGAHRVLLHP